MIDLVDGNEPDDEVRQSPSDQQQPCDYDDGDICTPKSEPSTGDDQSLD